ncbi:MAG: hypothetical protein ACQCN3_04650 [Candidatus Bathyarchaeia archaeon]|jgi:hypothetical protein
MKKVGIIILLGAILLLSSNMLLMANAASDEGSLNSGYAVTNNYHGKVVQLGTPVTVTAMSTDSHVDYVVFIWKDASGNVKYQETVSVFTNGTTYNGKLVKYAVSTQAPDSLGDWGVQAKFYDQSNCCCTCDTRLATRATSFNVIPEVPILGTAGIAFAMVLGLTVFKTKKHQ